MPSKFDWKGIAEQGAMDVTNGVMGLFLGKANDKRQLQQQQKLQNMQIAGNKEMIDYQKAADFDMWQKTGYEGQKAQMEAAGLNPGLLYGMGSGGGQTVGSSGGGVSGGQAPSGGGEIMGLMIKSNLAMQAAQIENIKADTKLKDADATKTAGADTDLANTQRASLTQGIENQKAQEALTRIEAQIKEVDLQYQNRTLEDRTTQWSYIIEKAQAELGILRNEGTISEATVKEKTEIVRQELAGIILKNEATKAGINLTAAQIDGIRQSIQTQITQLEQGKRSLDQKDVDLIIQKERNKLIELGIWVGGASNIIKSAVDVFTKGRTTINNHEHNTTNEYNRYAIQE